MRVITGTAKGKPLKSLQGRDTRPTGDRVKEAMFSAIQFDVEGAAVLDLFAGSGQLGIEALSRGAKKAYFADGSLPAVAVIRENLEYTGLAQSARVDRLPYDAFLRLCREKFDIAFLDPPYGLGLIGKVLPALIEKMNPGGVIVCEHESRETLPEKVGDFSIVKSYRYGSVSVTVYRGGSFE